MVELTKHRDRLPAAPMVVLAARAVATVTARRVRRNYHLAWWEGNLQGVAFMACTLSAILSLTAPHGSFAGSGLVWILLLVGIGSYSASWAVRRYARAMSRTR